MSKDPIIEELHRQRGEEMERFGFDFEAYCRSLKEEEKRSGELVVAPPDPPAGLLVQRARAPRA